MTTIANAYINALLADAAYVNLTLGMSEADMKRDLGERMTPTQAAYLAANFEVASSINSSDIPLVGSGFDATVWRGKAGTEFAGQTFVSMRGTEPDVLSGQGADLLADGDLAFNAGARSQIVDMVNWWLSARTTTGQPAMQIKWDPLRQPNPNSIAIEPGFVLSTTVVATGELAGIADVHVNGHSLGGHLAAAFARIFGGSITIDGISTFNSAGFNASAEPMFTQLQALLGTGLANYASDKQTNYYSENGTNFTTNTWWFEQMGERVGLYQEEGTGIPNHLIYKQTDLLALGSALEKLDPTFTIAKLNTLVKAGSNDMKASLEGVLDGLLKALVAPNLAPIPAGDVSDSATSRLRYHEAIAALLKKPAFTSLEGKLIVKASSAADLVAAARHNFGALVALQDLSPLVLSAINPAADVVLNFFFEQSRSADYTAWSADKSASTPSTFTDQWMADRTAMLTKLLERNIADAQGVLSGSNNIRYFDKTSSTEILIGAGSAQRQQFIFGGAEDDSEAVLSGQGFADHIYGAGGNDTLDGKGGNDYLEGGTGNDTYIIAPNSGQDTVLDADGLGHIELAGRSLNGTGDLLTRASTVANPADTSQPYTVWIDTSAEQQPIHYVFNSLTAELTITGAGSSVVVKNFSSGRLGIVSPVTLTPPTPHQVQTSFDLSLPGDRSALAMLSPAQQNNNLLLGNAIVSDAPTSVSGYSGNDVLLGGNIVATYGSVLNGGAGDDQLWATTASTLEDAIARGESAAANGSGTLVLAGGAGRDLVVGDVGDDVLFGGLGEDTLIGGSGDDIILADGDASTLSSDTSVTDWSSGKNSGSTPSWLRMRVNAATIGTTASNSLGQRVRTEKFIDININPLANTDFSGLLAMQSQNISPEAGDTNVYMAATQKTYAELYGGSYFGTNVGSGADVVYAGAGDDVVNAGAGDDMVFGGTGNDMVAGYEGDDFIDGGAGNDVLWGDFTAKNGNVPQVTNTLFGASWSIKLELNQALHGRDYIDGGAGDDIIYGGGASDTLLGGAGNDVIYGDDFGVTAQYAGDDYIDGGDGNDDLYAGQGNDTLLGGSGDDYLGGDEGDDILQGGLGNDTLNGGAGNNIYMFERGGGQDYIEAASGTEPTALNTLKFGSGIAASDIDATRSGIDLILQIHGTSDTLTVASFYQGNNSGNPYNPVQQIAFVDGTVWLASDVMATTKTTTAAGEQLIGSQNPDTLVGGNWNDHLEGLAGNDVLLGGQGDDSLEGGDGNDTLNGGTGSNELMGAEGNDTYSNSGSAGVSFARDYSTTSNDTYQYQLGDGYFVIEDKGGVDAIVLGNLISPGDVKVFVEYQAGYPNNLVLTFNQDSSQRITWASVLDGETGAVVSSRAFESVKFSNGVVWTLADILPKALATTTGDDAVYGLDSNDSIDGGAGNDILWGYNGNDTLKGGDGDDVLRGNNGDDQLYGDAGKDTLNGDDGNDVLVGGAGDDKLTGGRGDDTYRYNLGDGKDIVTDGGMTGGEGGGYDRIELGQGITPGNIADIQLSQQGAVTLTFSDGGSLTIKGMYTDIGGTPYLGDAIDEIRFYDSTVWSWSDLKNKVTTLMGDANSQTIVGSDRSEKIFGMDGNDILIGAGGDDILDGGAGLDTLQGGTGNDTYVIDNVSDIVVENAEEGIDLVQSKVTFTLSSNVENITLTGTGAIRATGNALDNVLTGNSAANVLTGGMGNDIYVLGAGDTTVEALNEGIDTVQTSIAWTLGANVENLTLTGSAAINGTGNALQNLLLGNSGANTLDGGAGADTLIGGAGNDIYVVNDAGDAVTENLNEGIDQVNVSINYVLGANVENLTLTGTANLNGSGNVLRNSLTGNTGNNILDGGTSADTMAGGTGNDTYYVDDAGDVTTEAASSGTDTVISSINWTLATNLENLTLTGTANINATGNAAANVLTGNTVDNILDGGMGIDTLIGGKGNDTYVVDVAGDVITELANEGTDTVNTSVTYTLGANLENLKLTGTSAINGTGNTLANTITGNSGANTLDGGAGADTLVGGAGNDTYYVDNESDATTEAASAGTDTVIASLNWTLGTNLENLTLAGIANINATGNAVANVLTGNAGNNVLDGGAGADTMVGGAGNDTYIVDNTADVITEGASAGTDLVQSSVTYTLATNVENITLTGTAAVNGTGNTVDNILLGNAGVNVLTGNAGNDTLKGGAGADSLVGGVGNDTYWLGRGYGIDTITENDAASGNTDVARFDTGITTDQLWFTKVGNNLDVSIIGTTDKFTLANWYLGSQYHVEQFKTSDGKTLLDSQVQNLVNAMAAFSPPTAGQTTLPANYASSLSPVIAANWQ